MQSALKAVCSNHRTSSRIQIQEERRSAGVGSVGRVHISIELGAERVLSDLLLHFQ